jgi:hypothetical protein
VLVHQLIRDYFPDNDGYIGKLKLN